jgi:four helix bundle protein
MKKQTYQDLKIWQQAHELALEIYSLTASFPKEEMYGITSQIKRSATSIPANIVEGYGRQSNKDFSKFLYISLGSLEETTYFLLLAMDLHFIDESAFKALHSRYLELRLMLLSFIRKVNSN